LEQSVLIEVGLPLSLMIIMTGMGLTLTVHDFRRVFAYPRAMVVGTLAQIVLMPLLAFALIYTFSLSPMIAVGLVVIAACPGGTTSNVFAYLAHGTLALSITLTVIASVITVFTIPFFTNIALELFTEVDVDDPLRLPVLRTIITLAVIVIVPVLIGMAIRANAEGFARRAEGAISLFGVLVLLALIIAIVYQVRADLGGLLAEAGPSAAALNLAGMGLGFLAGTFSRISHRDALTIAIEVGIKNGTLGLMVTLSLLGSEQMAIPSAVYGLLMYGFGAGLIFYGRWRFPNRIEAAPRPAGET
jgi:bile acid:Na+ symporter, BASS family